MSGTGPASTPTVKSALVGFAPGAVGGVCNVIVGQPIDLVKVRQQTATASSSSSRGGAVHGGGKGGGAAARSSTATHSSVLKASSRRCASTKTTATTPARTIASPFGLLNKTAAVGGRSSARVLASATSIPSAGTLGSLRSIVLSEGVMGLYAGVAAPLVAVVPAYAITFASYDLAKRAQMQYTGKSELAPSQIAAAGAFSGVPLAMVLGPLERIKCLMQVDKVRYGNFFQCIRTVYKEGGMRSLFRGTGITVMRDVPGTAAYFATYEVTKNVLRQCEGKSRLQDPSVASILLAGGVAGVVNWTIAIPVDVVKSLWQTSRSDRYRNVAHVVRSLLAREGPSAFVRGLSPALIRAFPSNAACLLGVEMTKNLLLQPSA